MKALILYRSHYGNTKRVAEILAGELVSRGIESEVRDLRAKLPDLAAYDAALIGAPTRMARVTSRAIRVLRKMAKRGWGKKPLAVFDTYGPIPTNPEELEKGKKWLYPGAAGIMQAKAMSLGLAVYPETLRCEVAGMKGPLKDGESEKAATFARKFVHTIKPRS